jgi:nucleotide-binding universal stress UspA family protein
MYKKVLVPLDGSPLAENVLAHAGSIVNGCGTETLVFLRVVEPAIYLPDDQKAKPLKWDVLDRMNEDARKEAQQYLAAIVAGTAYRGVEVQPVVIVGKTADTICEFAEKNGFDLIIMATHGRSGVKRLVWGSVADRVLRSSCVPVLLVRPPDCAPHILEGES